MSGWQRLRLYHGTDAGSAASIRKDGVQLSEARTRTDFGPGFYLTSIRYQAEIWASNQAQALFRQADFIEIDVSRYDFHHFKVLHFTIPDENYWQFVTHCRTEADPHHRCGNARRYDIVIGPVAKDWRNRHIEHGYDQFSFHTDNAIDWLNDTLGVARKKA